MIFTFENNFTMPLNKDQESKIDEMIGNNKKEIDIIQELVANHMADAREVSTYVKNNKTLQGMLKTITHRTQDIIKAGDLEGRTKIAKEIETLAKRGIKILQKKNSA